MLWYSGCRVSNWKRTGCIVGQWSDHTRLILNRKSGCSGVTDKRRRRCRSPRQGLMCQWWLRWIVTQFPLGITLRRLHLCVLSISNRHTPRGLRIAVMTGFHLTTTHLSHQPSLTQGCLLPNCGQSQTQLVISMSFKRRTPVCKRTRSCFLDLLPQIRFLCAVSQRAKGLHTRSSLKLP